MTGSAINIAAGQVPALFGLAKRFDTRAATYKVIINTLKNLHLSTLDAAFGVCSLAILYAIKWGVAGITNRHPGLARPLFFVQALRHAFVIILFTIVSWRINIQHKTPRISLVGAVPSGLQHVGRPTITTDLLSAIAPHIPVATIILLLEHISIAKSFGRLNGYKINPNQELIAIGVNNTLGTLFSAYPSTGSFSRSALKSKAGVRTPAAGIPTGIVVIIALYAVAPAFYWIPNASISALIIHAVADLVASPKQSFGFWRVSPFEYIIFVGAVLWSLFYSIESGIYWSLVTSIVLLLFRIARPKGHFLGRVRIRPENRSLAIKFATSTCRSRASMESRIEVSRSKHLHPGSSSTVSRNPSSTPMHHTSTTVSSSMSRSTLGEGRTTQTSPQAIDHGTTLDPSRKMHKSSSKLRSQNLDYAPSSSTSQLWRTSIRRVCRTWLTRGKRLRNGPIELSSSTSAVSFHLGFAELSSPLASDRVNVGTAPLSRSRPSYHRIIHCHRKIERGRRKRT